MQFSLTLHYILDKRLIHVWSKNRMYDLACFTSIKNVEKAVMHYSRKSMKKKITFGLIQRIQVLHCKSITHGATKHHKHISVPAYKRLLASIILEGGSICTHKIIP